MKNYKHILIIFVCFLLAGCVSTKYVSSNQYLLDLPKLATKNSTIYPCSLFVDKIDAIAPFDQRNFLYRTRGNRYLTDYYNGFLAAPAEQLDAILRLYFKEYGKFSLDVTEVGTSKNRLQVKLVELYADYRDRNNPQGVLALQFILTRLVENKNVVLLDRVFRSSIPLRYKSTAALLQAWNLGAKDAVMKGLRALNYKLVVKVRGQTLFKWV